MAPTLIVTVTFIMMGVELMVLCLPCFLCCANVCSKRLSRCCRMFSMWRYFLFSLWLCCFVIGETIHWQETNQKNVVKYISISFIAFSVVVVLIESGSSRELYYLRKISRDKTALEYIQEQQLLPPLIEMNVKCYHEEQYIDEEGVDHVDRVVSFVDSGRLSYGSWADVSLGDPLLGCTTSTIRISIQPDFIFGDQEIADDFWRMKTAMIERNRDRDEFNEFVLNLKIPEMKKTFCGPLDTQVKPSVWMRPLFFWIATFLWMTWPYRWLFLAKTDNVHYTLKKKIYTNVTPPNKEGRLHLSITDKHERYG